MAAFKRLVRFASPGSGIHYGDLLDVIGNQHTVRRLEGNPFTGLKATGETLKVDSLTVPKYPVSFIKPADSLAGPFDAINIHADARELLDYEGELTIVIGKDAKDVTEDTALDYVLGYTAGNDLSARNFQLPENSGGQFCYAKSFDKFAPIGHTIVATETIPDPQALRLTTKVNGVVKQETSTADMIWTVRQIITHLSRGTTLRKGTLIMTGTPSGVGYFRKEFLRDNDVVEVEIEGVASTKNRIHHG
ncbi:fumarylacetoacetate hydrolase family protein [Penicillium manginii]|uniref:fumarylacetoacetate hydrolase family protein n=1 Tax=Penicillium manginii TaxID=203109 RepID=UPI002547B3AE|nr:fumarylacetoacetate hydrolase family protein [Penicillium manginii]KAJ5744137.1 fumarylacetoacetate hydrolase family protein [Penicillium manginii]